MLSPGSPVPEVTVHDGRGQAELPVFFDRNAFLIFFRADCAPCDMLLSHADSLRMFEKAVAVIGVSQDDAEATAQLFQRLGIQLPVILDLHPFPATEAFGIRKLPAFVVVRDDEVDFAAEGLSVDTMQAVLRHLEGATGLAAPDINGLPIEEISGPALTDREV